MCVYSRVIVLLLLVISVVVFFFKQKTAYEMRISDWSSDVCSSDLEIQPSERRKFVEHQQQAPRSIARPEFFGETAPDLVEDEPDERLRPADIAGRYDQIERHGLRTCQKIGDPPFGRSGDRRDHGIAVEAEKRHGGRQDARTFLPALFEQFLPRPRQHT